MWGPDTNNQSLCVHCIQITLFNVIDLLQDLYLLGQTELDVYVEDYKDTYPDLMDVFYGIDGVCLQYKEHQTGAGNPLDEESESDIMSTANCQQE